MRGAGPVERLGGTRGGPEDRADAEERRPLLGGDAIVLARAHRELAQAVRLGQLAEPPEVWARGLRIAPRGRHRHQAAHVVVALEERGQLLRRDPRLRALAREVDLDECRHLESTRGLLRAERVAELADPVHDLRLAALEVTDEVPAE